MKQKALIVRDVRTISTRVNLDELNKCLEEGWKVVNTCPMPSSASVSISSGSTYKYEEKVEIDPTCLVILQWGT